MGEKGGRSSKSTMPPPRSSGWRGQKVRKQLAGSSASVFAHFSFFKASYLCSGLTFELILTFFVMSEIGQIVSPLECERFFDHLKSDQKCQKQFPFVEIEAQKSSKSVSLSQNRSLEALEAQNRHL